VRGNTRGRRIQGVGEILWVGGHKGKKDIRGRRDTRGMGHWIGGYNG